jgi:hypothetical protein
MEGIFIFGCIGTIDSLMRLWGAPRLVAVLGTATVAVVINLLYSYLLWRRAIDQVRNIRVILVQRRRDQHAAKKFFRKLLKGLAYAPQVIITDQPTSWR